MSYIRTDKLEAAFAAAIDPRVLRTVARELKKPLREDQRDHAKAQEGPLGKWPKRKLGGRRRVLGRLPGAIRVLVSHEVGGSVVTATSKVKWSGAHQDGPTRVGHGTVLPRRQFLWISPRLAEIAAASLAAAAAAPLGGS